MVGLVLVRDAEHAVQVMEADTVQMVVTQLDFEGANRDAQFTRAVAPGVKGGSP
jgi:hypothetical protein